MAEPGIAAQGTSLIWGHVALVACTVLYLAWWLVFFNPRLPKAAGALYAVGVACIVGAAMLGIAGVVLAVRGVGGLVPAMTRGVPVWAIAAGGIVAYVVLVLVTTRFFHRPVTTELRPVHRLARARASAWWTPSSARAPLEGRRRRCSRSWPWR